MSPTYAGYNVSIVKRQKTSNFTMNYGSPYLDIIFITILSFNECSFLKIKHKFLNKKKLILI